MYLQFQMDGLKINGYGLRVQDKEISLKCS